MKFPWCVCLILVLGTAAVEAGKRWGGFGGRRGGSSTKHRVPAPSPPVSQPGNSGGRHSGSFLDAERGNTGGTTHDRGPFSMPVPGSTHTNPNHQPGPIGFERLGGSNQGHQIGFDKVNSQSNKPNPYNPSAPPAPVGPPPAYPGTHFTGHPDHPPAYPGRPVNAPPAYTPNQHYPSQQQFGNGFPHDSAGSYGYQGNAYGDSPFGGGGYSGNPYYSPNNFGYSSNPGYFGGGYPGHDYQQKSRFGGFPIPIPIPIPIPFGGFGGFGGHSSYDHRVLHSFIRSSNVSSSNSSSSVFLLNNSTVAPCTTDHFLYDKVRVTTLACTAQACTAVKVQTRSVSTAETVLGGAITVCREGENVTVSTGGEIVTPTVSEVRTETITVCRNVSSNATTPETTTPESTTMTESTTTSESTTTESTTAVHVNTTVCEKVNCSSVEMCLPALEMVDPCAVEPCPFKRTGYRPCVVVKTCFAPSAPVSTFVTLNTTISKIDEYNKHRSVYDTANLTLISYHPPVTPVFKKDHN